MKIVVVGAGAVGGYFGAMLAKAGHDVAFVARGAQLAALRERGLKLTGARGDIVIERCVATGQPAELPAADAVLFCVKLYDTEDAARQIAPLIAKGGVCVSLQNGVDAYEKLAPILGADRVMGGLAYMSGVIAEPGVIRYASRMSSIVFGERDGSSSARAIALRDACVASGFDAVMSSDIRSAQWSKFVGLATNAALSCVVRQPAGVVYRSPDLIDIARRAFGEVAAVARAQKLNLAEDIVEQQMKLHQSFPPEMYASMFHDLRQGRRLELEGLSGIIVRKGRELGVATPVHEFAYAVLKPYLNGEPKVPVA